ncbi:allantoinase AllB [Paenibacillus daejeonensis]|uniref:allantoinase AllB n=1 Tax=Paenibacillus daejeonensis TaxID=135193 RepID=UPI0003632973|nr:allantoinase AllB [Paenibacillus daejeonensis]
MTKHVDLIIKNGTVVLKDDVRRLDIAIHEGKIVQLGEKLGGAADQTVDADGLTVMAGMVDSHVHLNEPGLGDWEGFETGTAALVAGGCTTLIDMPLNGIPPTVSVSALERKLAAAEGKSRIDYALWGGLVPGKLHELEGLAAAGVTGFKAFMSSPGDPSEEAFREVDDHTLLEGMRILAGLGRVLALHAESEPIVSVLAEQAREAGKTSPADYAATRPVLAELEAVNRALFYAEQTGCALHFVHISSGEAIRLIQEARSRGMDVTTETCPHYLVLTERAFETVGAAAKCAPPLRDEAQQEALWELLADGAIDLIASDHSPCPAELKDKPDFFEAWGGIAGAQNSLELIVGEGHVKRGLPLPLLSRVLSLAPARRFGLHPRKGEIRIGADADLVLLDLEQTYRLQQEQLLHRHKHNPYIGRTMHCRVTGVYSRGRHVYDGAAGLLAAGGGNWLKHQRVD